MGKHFLMLLLGLSLVVGFVQALTCFRCSWLNADGVCEKGETTCEAKDGEECNIIVVSKGCDILFGQQDCSSWCLNNTFIHYNITLDFSCCHDENMCNEF
ncbi:secreted seminal-vesicle Ly-6 protein 1-like [Mesocricetus auratus]|uniref:Secreted seminal-vesicle Ly-6 protein 1-like n=1 Tax=Mesocricetus auratus TaxID=10036 RepID=A0ABM2W4W1_MESAU|nr:secreted seminal-vesicle Ly-6 protein 1-like [Mesocricetus auratus]